MSLKIGVCDDVLADRQRLISLIKVEYPHCQCLDYKSAEMLLWDFENSTHFDILFLDIFMEGMSGIEVAKRIRILDPNLLLIFVSSSNDFYRESYDLYAFNYLIKPLTVDKLTEVLQRATQYLDKNTGQVIRFSFNNKLYKLRCSEILYISSDKHIVNFHTINGEVLKSYGKLDNFIRQLPSEVFVRCHQSYIVNLNHVTGMTTAEFLFSETTVPISRKYLSNAREKYQIAMFSDF